MCIKLISKFTDYLFVPVLRPFHMGDRVLFKGKPGTILRTRRVGLEYVTDWRDGSRWRPCSKLDVTIRFDVAGATAGVRFDPAHGHDRLQHLVE